MPAPNVRPLVCAYTAVLRRCHLWEICFPRRRRNVTARPLNLLLAQCQFGNSICTYVAFCDDVDWVTRQRRRPQRPRRVVWATLLQWFTECSVIARAMRDVFIGRPMHAMSIQHVWDTRAGVTILGDAAHLIFPFFGYGVSSTADV